VIGLYLSIRIYYNLSVLTLLIYLIIHSSLRKQLLALNTKLNRLHPISLLLRLASLAFKFNCLWKYFVLFLVVKLIHIDGEADVVELHVLLREQVGLRQLGVGLLAPDEAVDFSGVGNTSQRIVLVDCT
jgi:hypothetical protein